MGTSSSCSFAIAPFNELALDSGPPIDKLAITRLADITDKDFAKAWSFYDYLAMKMGREGQVWLRQTCFAAGYKKRSDFMRRWRKFSEEIFGVTGQDVYKVMDDKWRAYAEDERAKEY